MDIVDDLRKDSRDEKEQYKREARTVMRRLLKEAADIIEQLRGQVEFASECRNGAYADVEIQNAKIERLRGVLLTVLEACKDVNSPDRKVREEITRTVRNVYCSINLVYKALKEKE